MYKERMNRTEIFLLKTVHKGPASVTSLAAALEISKSYGSECVSHLSSMGFVETTRLGNRTMVKMPSTSFGNELSILLREEPMLNLELFMGGSRLKVLPTLLGPGHTAKEIARRTKLSPRTVQAILGKWRQMGIAVLGQKKYTLNQRNKIICDFVEKYSEHRSLHHMRSRYPDATMVWHRGDEYILSSEKEIYDAEYAPAGTTRLAELGYDILYRIEYYHHGPIPTDLPEAEILVQVYAFDLGNPRAKRYIRTAIKDARVKEGDILGYAAKYGIQREIEVLLDG